MFSLIMCIPTVILLMILCIYTNNSVQAGLIQEGENSLRRIDDTLDYSLYTTIYQQNMMMSNAQYNLSLKKVLERKNMDFKDYIFMSALKTLLTNYESSHSYIHSTYLYLDEGERFMTSSSSYLTSEHSFYDEDWMDIYQEIPKEVDQYIVKRPIREYMFEEEQEVLTIFKRMIFQEGVIVINIKKEDYQQMTQSLMSFPEQIFCLVNSDGKIIYAGDETLEEDTTFTRTILPDMVRSRQDNRPFAREAQWITLNGKKYLMNTNPSGYFNAYQISLIPLSCYLSKIYEMTGWAGFIFLLNIGIIIILSWITTKRSFNYIQECIEIFSAAEKGEQIEKKEHDTKDEYSLILNNVIYMYLRNNQMQVNLMEKQHQTQMAEMKALQLQINPHFIFNTLQTMDMEIMKTEGVHATSHMMLQELASIIKYAFTNPMERVTIEEELEYLSAYFRIQEIRFPKRLIWYYEVDEDVLKYKIFRLLLQPMIENCINHGMRGKERIAVKIKIFREDNMLSFSIIDTGCGMNKEEIAELYRKMNDKKTKNIGLTNVNRRLILNYGEGSKLHIRAKARLATGIYFKIPIEQLDEIAEGVTYDT